MSYTIGFKRKWLPGYRKFHVESHSFPSTSTMTMHLVGGAVVTRELGVEYKLFSDYALQVEEDQIAREEAEAERKQKEAEQAAIKTQARNEVYAEIRAYEAQQALAAQQNNVAHISPQQYARG